MENSNYFPENFFNEFDEHFDIIVNVSRKELFVSHKMNKDDTEDFTLHFDELDEWQSFKTNDTFDLHLDNDEKNTVSVYRIDTNLIDQTYSDSLKVNLTII